MPAFVNARDGHAKVLLTLWCVIPLGLVFIVFAVANRHFVTVSFDPFDSSDPAVAVTMPLFVVIIAVAILGVAAGGSATWFRQRHWRRAARRHEAEARRGAGGTGRSARRCGGPARRAAAPSRTAAGAALTGPPGETSRARRCRTRPVSCLIRPVVAAALKPAALRDHVPARQNLRPVHARDARRRAGGRRRHGRLRVLSAVAAPSQPRDRARTRRAGQGPRRQGGADGRCRRRHARQHRRGAAAGSAATARQGNRRRGCATSSKRSACRS